MQENPQTLADFINYWTGGVGATLGGGLLGRLMWHAQEARKARRRFLGPELFWELPIACGMALIGEGAASWLGFGQPVSTGIVAALSYLGPRGAEVVFLKWLGRKLDGKPERAPDGN